MSPIASKPSDEQQPPRQNGHAVKSSAKTPKTKVKSSKGRSPKASGGADGQPDTPDANIPAALDSPGPSEFGEEYEQGFGTSASLPKHLIDFLERQELEAYYVPGDGNCFYRAVTFGPEFSKHDLLRLGLAADLGSLKTSRNVLGPALSWDQIQRISESMCRHECFLTIDGEWRDPDAGEVLRKAAAEVLRSDIKVWDAERLVENPDPYSYRPVFSDGEAQLFNDEEMPEVKPRRTEPIRLLLYKEHYYPLFPKGSFPNNRLEPGARKAQNWGNHRYIPKEPAIVENRIGTPVERPVGKKEYKDPGNALWEMITGKPWTPYQPGQLSGNRNPYAGIYLLGIER